MRVIAVHGTFASGPSKGNRWWQDAGVLNRELKKIDQAIEFIPFPWSGINSEDKRRNASKALFDLINTFPDEEFVLIGHSHGGLVIRDALARAINNSHPFLNLKKWITVGTPFIVFAPQIYPFRNSYLENMVTFISTASTFALYYIFFVRLRIYNFLEQPIFLISLSVPMIITILYVLIVGQKRLWRHKSKLKEEFAKNYGNRWVGLAHENDEAIALVKSAPHIDLKFADQKYLMPLVSIISILFAFFYILRSLIPNAQYKPPKPKTVIEYFQAYYDNFFEMYQLLIMPATTLAGTIPIFKSIDASISVPIILFVSLAIVFSILYFVFSIAVFCLGKATYKPLNAYVTGELRKFAFGDDVLSEIATDCFNSPFSNMKQKPWLSRQMKKEIVRRSGRTLSKNVIAVHGLILEALESGSNYLEVLQKYSLTTELIHNCYFESPAVISHIVAEIAGSQKQK